MGKVKLPIVKLYEDAKLPHKAHEQDAGWDVYAFIPPENIPRRVLIPAHKTVLISSGFKAAVPEGYFGTLMARSGLATKQGLRPANTIPVIDVGYTGEWKIALHNDSDEHAYVEHGDRICQLMLIPVPELELEVVNSLEVTDRGETGFGDSGKK